MPQIHNRTALAIVTMVFLAYLAGDAIAQSINVLRQKCIAEAQQRYPASDQEQMKNRTYIYAACMEGADLRP